VARRCLVFVGLFIPALANELRNAVTGLQ